MWSPGADAIAWSTGGVERMRLSSAGLSNQLGAVGTPSYSFTGDLDTGMWSPGADILALSTAGAERLRLDASGRVGIGTSSPQRPLHIAGTEPAMVLQETDQAADQQRWRVYSAGATFAIDAVNDAFSGAQVGYQMVRSLQHWWHRAHAHRCERQCRHWWLAVLSPARYRRKLECHSHGAEFGRFWRAGVLAGQ
jgi:hypothetical protein